MPIFNSLFATSVESIQCDSSCAVNTVPCGVALITTPYCSVTIFQINRPWKGRPGAELYRSPTLERLWTYGHSSIGELTYESAAYVARYCLKKTTGAFAKFVYTDPETGEMFTPEFARMSLKPGIGRVWFDEYADTDIFPHDNIIYKGSKNPVPRFYDKLWEKRSPDDFESVKFQRLLDAMTRTHESTPERLAVREEVFTANLKKLTRTFKIK